MLLVATTTRVAEMSDAYPIDATLSEHHATVNAHASQLISPQTKTITAPCAANQRVGQFSESQVLVPRVGVEPTWLAPEDFKSSLYTIPSPRHD